MNFTIQRDASTDEGTTGTITSDSGVLKLRTIELPWRNNEGGHSCIPPGTYVAAMFKSPSKGLVYLLRDVPGHSMIEIHPANWAGDTSKGWVSQLLGCIALGMGVAKLQNPDGKMQLAVTSSRQALDKFMAYTGGEPITLTIKGAVA